MPTYEYRCSKCGHSFEETQSITSDPLLKCPACGHLSLKRLVGGGGGMIFRGKGFYQTDYRKNERTSTSVTPSTTKKKNTKTSGETPASPPTPAHDTDTKPGSSS